MITEMTTEMTGHQGRQTTMNVAPDAFRNMGYELVDRIAEHLSGISAQRVMPAAGPAEVRAALGASAGLPEDGSDPREILQRAANLLFQYSTFIGHPKFFGYITSGGTPLGALGDFLAAAVNPNVGAWKLSPMATEIEAQTIRWIADLIGFPSTCGGLLVSGGNMANFVGVYAARAARAPWDVRKLGMSGKGSRLMRIYASTETHTWVEKAADLCGMGTDAIRWIPVVRASHADIDMLDRMIREDEEEGTLPLMVVGTAGSVSTGAVDPLPEMAAFCRERGIWFHVDGAYGAVATGVPGAPRELEGLREADSLALDPHKWLYAPLEAGCALVRDPAHLLGAFSYHPPYYNFEVEGTNYFDFGMQNSRGFRALKVWMGMQQAGRAGIREMIGTDIRLAETLFEELEALTEFDTHSQNLSIVTFRYIPRNLIHFAGDEGTEDYLNRLNQAILGEIEKSGEAFLSQAIVNGKFFLRACVLNYRTEEADIRALPEIIARLGRQVDARLRVVDEQP